MQWEDLLKPYRLGCSKDDINEDMDRTNFQRDFYRIIFSTPFRRLNGKTQVFPFPESDIIHTRLTHSLETASAGRSLGTIAGNKLNERGRNIQGCDLGAIVSAASLAHDIGNPPLGHSGEKAISEFFLSERGREIIADLCDEQKADFTTFEGNSMGFHLLTYSNPILTNVTGGLGLTYPVVASFMKYPRPSLVQNEKKIVCEKKPGIFQFDLEIYHEISHELGIPLKEDGDRWYRHPLAFLTEAADDICYAIMDLEDGYKHGLLDYQTTASFLTEICIAQTGETNIDALKNIIDERNRIGFLRAKAINSLIHQSAKVFLENEEAILEGKLDQPLSEIIESAHIREEILNVSFRKIYSYKPVLQVEAAGFWVLPGLLDTFLYAIKEPGKASSKKIQQLIPNDYRADFDKDPYEAIIQITAYIAGMTDSFAIDTYRNLRGIQLPNH
ncbi:MAG: dGTP triphosphohydrolase [Syntrophomonas sp.]